MNVWVWVGVWMSDVVVWVVCGCRCGVVWVCRCARVCGVTITEQ